MGVEPTPYRETVGHLNRLTLEPKKGIFTSFND